MRGQAAASISDRRMIHAPVDADAEKLAGQ